jgi:sec-independent protein translocase protein TatC
MALMDFFNRRKQSATDEMSFIDHLEELRWHLIRSVVAIVIAAIVFFVYVREIVNDILLAPAHDDFITYGWFCRLSHALGMGDALCMSGVKVSFLSTQMTGQFISSFTISFVGGFVVAFPYVFWEFWRFVKPALSEKEKQNTGGVIFWVSLLFFTGVAF